VKNSFGNFVTSPLALGLITAKRENRLWACWGVRNYTPFPRVAHTLAVARQVLKCA
jgi:hypothetical protein